MRIFAAIQNAEWLRQQMLPNLIRQAGKWWEVNPYILGLDEMLKELLNIKPLDAPIEYFGLTIQFSFDAQTARLTCRFLFDDGIPFSISSKQAACFEMKNGGGQSFLPRIPELIELSHENQSASFDYDLTKSNNSQLVLIFNDPRPGKSSQLFFLLT